MYDATPAETVTSRGDGGDEIEACQPLYRCIASASCQCPVRRIRPSNPVSHTSGLLRATSDPH